MKHRTSAALAASALVLGGLAAVTATSPAEAAGGWRSFGGANFGPIPDGSSPCPAPGPPRDVTFTVAGMPAAQLAGVRVRGLAVTHLFAGDVTATLIAPGGGAQQVLFGRTGSTLPISFGEDGNLSGPYTFTDSATPPNGGWWQAAATVSGASPIPAGDYFATTRGEVSSGGAPVSLTGAFAALTDPNGTWTLRVSDSCFGDAGAVSAATLDLRVASEVCATEQSELAFQQASVAAASTAVGAAQQAASAAATSLTSQDAAVAAAQKAVKKAKKAKKAKKRAVARAKARLAKAVLAQTRAQGAKATADAQVGAATAALSSAQGGVTRAQAILGACQQE